MRSINARYQKLKRTSGYQYSSYLCFARSVRGQMFSYEIVSKWFNILVEKTDYRQQDRNAIVAHLHKLSNNPLWRRSLSQDLRFEAFEI